MTDVDAYYLVGDALGRRPRESLAEAAARVMRRRRGHRAWAVARAVLSSGNAWTCIRAAARLAIRQGLRR